MVEIDSEMLQVLESYVAAGKKKRGRSNLGVLKVTSRKRKRREESQTDPKR